ncbi:MAG: hypothetical protein MZV64_28990 [Ignavibacteriales bacterium]|nr:hypothetical protein [Ignavibacteriales bacterium]
MGGENGGHDTCSPISPTPTSMGNWYHVPHFVIIALRKNGDTYPRYMSPSRKGDRHEPHQSRRPRRLRPHRHSRAGRIRPDATPLSAQSAPDAPLWMRYPAISPDGQTIAFAYKGDIYRVPAAGGAAVPLTTHEAHDYDARLEPRRPHDRLRQRPLRQLRHLHHARRRAARPRA